MQTTIDISPDLLAAAKRLAEARDTTIDLVVTELLRKELSRHARIEERDGFPVIVAPIGATTFNNDDVARARDEEDDAHGGGG
jgi:hypothetical protein